MPWDPVLDMLTMHERLESLFGQANLSWVPPVDLAEFDEKYVLMVELPGLTREAVTIEYSDQVLTVRGSRPPQACPDRYQQLERGQGRFSRSFRFAAPIVSEAISADIVDGILTVTVPKSVIDRRRIEVS